MQPYAEQFYKSKTWQHCRESYAKSVGYVCEDCRAKGIMRAGDEVHHIVPITPSNINDPNITLAHGNLVFLCHDCHMKRHKKNKRFEVDELGRVTAVL